MNTKRKRKLNLLFLSEDDEAYLKAYNEKVMEDQNRARAKAVEF